jgi:hypothetical protein
MNREEMLQDLNTMYPGTIVSFDPLEQTAVVRMALEQYYTGIDTAERYEDAQRPLLTDVPVHFPQCKGFNITMPVGEGDSCLLVFAQRGIGHWLYDNKEVAGRDEVTGWPEKEHMQQFELSSTLCIVGFNPIPKAIADFNPLDLEIRNADRTQRITLLADGRIDVSTTNDVTVTTPTIVNVNCTAAVVTAATSITLATPLVVATGDLTVGGTMTASTDALGGGISLLGHEHGGDGGTGSGPSTGPPL